MSPTALINSTTSRISSTANGHSTTSSVLIGRGETLLQPKAVHEGYKGEDGNAGHGDAFSGLSQMEAATGQNQSPDSNNVSLADSHRILMTKEVGPAVVAARQFSSGSASTGPALSQIDPTSSSTTLSSTGKVMHKQEPRLFFKKVSDGKPLAAHVSIVSSVKTPACANDELEFLSCWEPTSPIPAFSRITKLHGTDSEGVESLESCYQRMLGVGGELGNKHMNEDFSSEEAEGEEPLMMKLVHITSKVSRDNDGDRGTNLEQQQHEEQDQGPQKPVPQNIPQILVQTVTPPDSRPLQQQHMPHDEITTGRPSPVLAPIASRPCPLSVTLVPSSSRLPRDVNLATPEDTLKSQQTSTPPSSQLPPASRVYPQITVPKPQSQREALRSPPVLHSLRRWETHESWSTPVAGCRRSETTCVLPSPVRRNTAPVSDDITASFLRRLVPSPTISRSTGSQIQSPGSVNTVRRTSRVQNDKELAINTPRVVIVGFDCPPENYIHEDFTKEALRRRWEYAQSWTQWPKLKEGDSWIKARTEPDSTTELEGWELLDRGVGICQWW